MPTLAQACLLFACPTCLTPIGARCVTGTGNPSNPHAKRRDRGEGWLAREPEVADLHATIAADDELIRDVSAQRNEAREALGVARGEVARVTALWSAAVGERDAATTELAETKRLRDQAQQELSQINAKLSQNLAQLDTERANVTQLRIQVSALEAYKAAHPDTPPVVTPPVTPPVVVGPARPIPAAAKWVHPNGNDANPGTEAKPLKTIPNTGGIYALGGDEYNGVTLFTKSGSVTSLYVPSGKTVVFHGGKAVKNAITAGGVLNIYGNLVVKDYHPGTITNGQNAPVYYGGTSAGSEVDGLSVIGSDAAAMFATKKITLRHFLAEDIGYSALFASGANDSIFEDITLRRVNRGGYKQDGQLGAFKLSFSRRTVTRRLVIEDCPIGNGYWTDMGCQDSVLEDFDIQDAAGRMGKGVHPEAQVGGIVRRGKVRGSASGNGGVRILDAADITLEDVDVRGNAQGVWLQRDNRVNVGKDARDGTPAENPWDTRGVRLKGCTFDGKQQLWAYAENAPTLINGADMFDSVTGCTFGAGGGSARFRTGTDEYPTAAQFAARLGARWSGNTVL